MSRLSDCLLGSRQPHLGPHRPRQPRTRLDQSAARQSRPNHPARSGPPTAAGLPADPQMKIRGCSTPPRPRSARRLRTTSPCRIASSKPGSTPRRRSGMAAPASCISARRVARASPSSAAHSRAGPPVSSVAASRSAASTTAPNASAGAISIAESNRRAGSRHASKRDKNAAVEEVGPASLSTICRNPLMPRIGRGPRRHSVSSARAACRQATGLMPAPQRGCFNNAKSGTGANSSATARTSRRKNTAGGDSANGSPALSSATIPKRSNAAATRPARLRSGVTSAARTPGVSSASRSTRAMACASCCWSAAVSRHNPSTATGPWSIQSSRALAGSNARDSSPKPIPRHGARFTIVPFPNITAGRVQVRQQPRQTRLSVGRFQLLPRLLVHLQVELRQHDLPVPHPRDHTQQPGDCGNAGRGAGDQHRIVRRIVFPRLRLRLQQSDLSRGGVHHPVLR